MRYLVLAVMIFALGFSTGSGCARSQAEPVVRSMPAEVREIQRYDGNAVKRWQGFPRQGAGSPAVPPVETGGNPWQFPR